MTGQQEPFVGTRILGIAGSLRRGSFNRRLLEAAAELAPSDVRVEIAEIGDLALYDADLDTDESRPEAARRLKRQIAAADAVLFATPEYNHAVPGVLQNAIDWASRPAGRSPLAGKPVALCGASTGALGAARAQQQLKLVLLSTLAHVLPHPGVAVGHAAEKFDASGALVHAPTRDFLAAFVEQLAAWAQRLAPPGRAAARRVA